jgi:hypothetical protein
MKKSSWMFMLLYGGIYELQFVKMRMYQIPI